MPPSFKIYPFARSLLLCSLSAVLLVFSFPKIDCGPLIWISLVPWLFAIDGRRGPAVFGYSYFTGVLFFFGSLYWFMYVTFVGAILLMLYLALYFGAFGLVHRYFSRQSLWIKILALSSSWVALEYARGHLFSGFGWVSLCHSQYQNLALIQIADMTGIYGISFLVVAVNVLIKENIAFALGFSVEKSKDLLRLNLIILGVLVVVFGYGLWRLTMPVPMPMVKVAVVQGNIPQEEKWQSDNREATIDKYLKLSQTILQSKPDLLIWPETAFPGIIDEAPDLMRRIQDFARSSGIPVLLGIVTAGDPEYYNSALLISAQGEFLERYDKLHLVPFGEYLPFRKQFPFLTDLVPIEDFSPGRRPTVFYLSVNQSQSNVGTVQDSAPGVLTRGAPPFNVGEITFSVLICFEDTLARIARRFVQKDAQMLVNITNDAWFKDSKEPFMHLQAAVFRCIENRRSLVRAANTGVSCAVDPYGRVLKYVEDRRHKKTYIDGAAVFFVPLNTAQTLYTKFGDVFTYLCFVCILWAGYRERHINI